MFTWTFRHSGWATASALRLDSMRYLEIKLFFPDSSGARTPKAPNSELFEFASFLAFQATFLPAQTLVPQPQIVTLESVGVPRSRRGFLDAEPSRMTPKMAHFGSVKK